jgi:hypothetical protein
LDRDSAEERGLGAVQQSPVFYQSGAGALKLETDQFFAIQTGFPGHLDQSGLAQAKFKTGTDFSTD